MFRFLFKRNPGKPAAPSSPQAVVVDAVAERAVARRAQQMERASAVAADEPAAVELILGSELADVRLAAAAHVHSQAMLERVYQAVRNTDRRVAKLMHGRLDAIKHAQAEQKLAEACLETAQSLLQDAKLMPNQVALLDRRWQAIAPAPALAEQFGVIREGLTQRMQAQVNLQRAVIDSLSALRGLTASGLPHGELVRALQGLTDQHALHRAAPEHNVLPKQLMADLERELVRVTSDLEALEKHQAALDARQAMLAGWQEMDPASHNADSLRRSWQNLPGMPIMPGMPGMPSMPSMPSMPIMPEAGQAGSAQQAQLQLQFDALIGAIPEPRKAERPQNGAPPKPADQHFLDALDAMDAALQHGLLQGAYEHDKTLRDCKAVRLTPAQSERLANLRMELKRLGDWARWGGNVSREELVLAVEQLPAQGLAVAELPKKVGSMRERWKALDAVSGPAPKALWERFDAACSTAYEPAAAHFKQLAHERHANADKARDLIAQALAQVSDAAAGEHQRSDWKQLAGQVQRLRQAWTRLGTIERKDKKRLDAEFEAALQALEAPLARERQDEMARRDGMIAEVAALSPNERGTVDALRALQERWQQQAKYLPLERNAEQALWQRFRAACDGVFAKRKESASEADQERRAHLGAKQALCAQLEAHAAHEAAPAGPNGPAPEAASNGTASNEAAAIGKLLREADTAWNGIGQVPRAEEQKLEQRYRAAVARLRAGLEASKRNASAIQAGALREKLHLCQTLETALGHDVQALQPDWSGRWSALPPLGADYEAALHGRFQAAQAALTAGRDVYAARLEQNRAHLLQEVLRLEIALGVDSGAQFARERLELQVEGLQSSLKLGQKPALQAGGLLALCALPALADAGTGARIEQLIKRIGSSGASIQ